MQIEQCMKTQVVTVGPAATVRQAAAIMVEAHIGTLPVIDSSGVLIGLLTLADMLRLFMPDFVTLLEQINFVPDFGLLEARQLPAEHAAQAVSVVMRKPVSILRTTGLLRAFHEFAHHNVTDLPVVDEQSRLIGLASRVDIGTAFLQAWVSE